MTNNIDKQQNSIATDTEIANISNDDVDNALSPDVLNEKMKSRTKVRITAYQASILMDGINTVLDEIDKQIIDSASKNTNEISYKLARQFIPYYEKLCDDLKSRGFTVKSTVYDYYRMLYISWPTP